MTAIRPTATLSLAIGNFCFAQIAVIARRVRMGASDPLGRFAKAEK
jgi:hypothetical protein